MTGTHEEGFRRLVTEANVDEMFQLGTAMAGNTPTSAQIDAYQKYLATIAPDAEAILEHTLSNIFWGMDPSDEAVEQARRATVITMTAFVASALAESRRRDAESDDQSVSEGLDVLGETELPQPNRD